MKPIRLNASKKTKSTAAGELPVDWGCVHLREIIAELESGTSVSGYDRPASKTEMGVLKVSAVSRGKFIPEENKAILTKDIGRANLRPRMGAILVSRSNSPELVGEAALVSRRTDNLFLPDKLWQIETKPNAAVHAPWFVQVLLSKPIKLEMQNRASGTSQSMKNISKESFLSISIPFPPLPEQRQIADILTTWDDALGTLDALVKAKECRKKALMQQLLSGKMRLPHFVKSPWKKVRMGEVLTRVFRPIEWTADKPLSLVSLRRRCGGLFRRPDVLGADYKTQDLHELKPNDFLISKRQVVHGAWAMVTPEFAGCHVSKEYAIFVNQAPAKLDMAFFSWLAQTPRMIRLARVASTGVHIEKLIFDSEVFLRESIRIPSSFEEQKHIATILDTADKELKLLRLQRTAVDQQKQGLMQRLLTGKIRVRIK